MKNLLSLIILFLIITISTSIVVFPFYTNKQLSNFPEFNISTFLSYMSITLLTDIELGEPPQKIHSYLSQYTYCFELTNINNYAINYNYDISKSTSFINAGSFKSLGRDIIISKEIFYFYNDLSMKNKIKIKNITMLLSKNKDDNYTHYDKGVIGVKAWNNDDRNFNNNLIIEIGSLKSQHNFTKNYSWQLKTINNSNFDQWMIIIGEYPHEYNSKNFKEENLKYEQSASSSDWTLYIRQIKSANTVLGTDFKITIRFNYINFGAPEEYKNFTYENFFNDYFKKNICIENKGFITTTVYCKKGQFDQNSIAKFPKLEFYDIDLNYTFEFTGNDLFFEKNGYYYFMIQFQVKWYFGLAFLNKYPLIFNHETRLIYYYDYYLEETNKETKEDTKEEKKEVNSFKIDGKIIIGIVIAIIFLIVGLVAGKYFFGAKRKKKANELDDDYDYNQQEDKKNKLTEEENNIN